MLESLGLSGFYMSGDDIGGFAGSPKMDLLTKWIEVGAFNPIDRDHTTKGSLPQEPWVGGPAQEAIRRKYIETRYRLMPYFYTEIDRASQTGIPVMRPLFLDFPDATADDHPLDDDVPNEFLFGPDLLVAPAPYPDQPESYDVVFPPAPWYDFWTGQKMTHSQKAGASLETATLTPTLAVLPVYAKGGSVIPMQPLVQSTMQKPDGPLTLRVYPGPNCHGALYDDDGTTLDYKHGDYLRVQYTCESTPGDLTLHIGAQEGSYPAWWKQIRVQVFGWKSGQAQAEVDGKAVAGASVDATHGMAEVVIPQNANGETLTLKVQ
jgi:alpha-glucosidase